MASDDPGSEESQQPFIPNDPSQRSAKEPEIEWNWGWWHPPGFKVNTDRTKHPHQYFFYSLLAWIVFGLILAVQLSMVVSFTYSVFMLWPLLSDKIPSKSIKVEKLATHAKRTEAQIPNMQFFPASNSRIHASAMSSS